MERTCRMKAVTPCFFVLSSSELESTAVSSTAVVLVSLELSVEAETLLALETEVRGGGEGERSRLEDLGEAEGARRTEIAFFSADIPVIPVSVDCICSVICLFGYWSSV